MAEIDKIPAPDCNEGILEWISFDQILNIPTPKTDWYIYRFLLDKEKFVLNAEYDENHGDQMAGQRVDR
jgi:8-oxo-dGTP diphosphatase